MLKEKLCAQDKAIEVLWMDHGAKLSEAEILWGFILVAKEGRAVAVQSDCPVFYVVAQKTVEQNLVVTGVGWRVGNTFLD